MVYDCFKAKKFQSIFENISKPIALVFSHNLGDKKDGILVKKIKKYPSIMIYVCFKDVLYGLLLILS